MANTSMTTGNVKSEVNSLECSPSNSHMSNSSQAHSPGSSGGSGSGFKRGPRSDGEIGSSNARSGMKRKKKKMMSGY